MKLNNTAAFHRVGNQWQLDPSQECFSGVADNISNLSPATKTTDANGSINGGAPFNEKLPLVLNPNGPDDASALCIGNSQLSDGIVLPFQVNCGGDVCVDHTENYPGPNSSTASTPTFPEITTIRGQHGPQALTLTTSASQDFPGGYGCQPVSSNEVFCPPPLGPWPTGTAFSIEMQQRDHSLAGARAWHMYVHYKLNWIYAQDGSVTTEYVDCSDRGGTGVSVDYRDCGTFYNNGGSSHPWDGGANYTVTSTLPVSSNQQAGYAMRMKADDYGNIRFQYYGSS